VRVIMGPYGSGKSTWAATEIVRRACSVPVWYAGRRRSRWARHYGNNVQLKDLNTRLVHMDKDENKNGQEEAE